MDLRHGLLALCSALALTAFSAGSSRHASAADCRLQPFGGVVAGRYVDAGELHLAAPTSADSARARRFAKARERGLDALIIHPAVRRGAYRDCGAQHSAW